MQSTKIYFVRHGESVANRDNICGGDYPLTDKGRQQAAETKQLLATVHFDNAFSSDRERAIVTATIIFGKEIPVSNQLLDFRERAFGELEGGPNDVWAAIREPWEEKYGNLPFAERSHFDYADGIENDADLYQRVVTSLEKIAETHPGQTVLVVSSAGPVRMLLMGLGFANFLPAGSFKNAGYVELMSDAKSITIGKIVGVTKPEDQNGD